MLDRILALVFLLLASIVSPAYFSFVAAPESQLILGTLVVVYIILGDPIAGLMFGVTLLLMYFRVYAAKYGVTILQLMRPNGAYPMTSLVTDYITPEHLHKAQNNIVNDEDYAMEMKGVQGVYGEAVYGAQGTDATMPGFDVPAPGESLDPLARA
jgi:hypothetical protein